MWEQGYQLAKANLHNPVVFLPITYRRDPTTDHMGPVYRTPIHCGAQLPRLVFILVLREAVECEGQTAERYSWCAAHEDLQSRDRSWVALQDPQIPREGLECLDELPAPVMATKQPGSEVGVKSRGIIASLAGLRPGAVPTAVIHGHNDTSLLR